MIIELMGALYAPFKDFYTYYTGYPEKDKLVDIEWPQYSGFEVRLKEQGWKLGWCRPDLLARRTSEGHQVMYEVDQEAKVAYRLVLKDGLILVGKKVEAGC